METSIAVIRLTGELEIGRKDEIVRALQLTGGELGVLLDFSDVTYADSTALGEMLRFHNDAVARGVPVAILIASRQFARLIRYAGLSDAFHIFNDRAAALTDIAQAART